MKGRCISCGVFASWRTAPSYTPTGDVALTALICCRNWFVLIPSREQLASDTSTFGGGAPFSMESHGYGNSMRVSWEIQRARSGELVSSGQWREPSWITL